MGLLWRQCLAQDGCSAANTGMHVWNGKMRDLVPREHSCSYFESISPSDVGPSGGWALRSPECSLWALNFPRCSLLTCTSLLQLGEGLREPQEDTGQPSSPPPPVGALDESATRAGLLSDLLTDVSQVSGTVSGTWGHLVNICMNE